jgi:hypothetical protein
MNESNWAFGEREAQSTRDARSHIAWWSADEERAVASQRWKGLAEAGKRKGEPYVRIGDGRRREAKGKTGLTLGKRRFDFALQAGHLSAPTARATEKVHTAIPF